MLDWFDRFHAAVLSCERRSEEIADDRFRAAKRQMEDLKEQFVRLTPEIR